MTHICVSKTSYNLDQIKACWLVGAKLFSEPMLECYQLDQRTNSSEILIKNYIFSVKKMHL